MLSVKKLILIFNLNLTWHSLSPFLSSWKHMREDLVSQSTKCRFLHFSAPCCAGGTANCQEVTCALLHYFLQISLSLWLPVTGGNCLGGKLILFVLSRTCPAYCKRKKNFLLVQCKGNAELTNMFDSNSEWSKSKWASFSLQFYNNAYWHGLFWIATNE